MTDPAGAQRVEAIKATLPPDENSHFYRDAPYLDNIRFLLARLRTVEAERDLAQRQIDKVDDALPAWKGMDCGRIEMIERMKADAQRLTANVLYWKGATNIRYEEVQRLTAQLDQEHEQHIRTLTHYEVEIARLTAEVGRLTEYAADVDNDASQISIAWNAAMIRAEQAETRERTMVEAIELLFTPGPGIAVPEPYPEREEYEPNKKTWNAKLARLREVANLTTPPRSGVNVT